MTMNIRFSADRATLSLSATVLRSGRLEETVPAPDVQLQYPALQRLRALLPEVLAELAPGYIEAEACTDASSGRRRD